MFEPRWKVDSSHPLPAFPLKGRNEQPDVSCPCTLMTDQMQSEFGLCGCPVPVPRYGMSALTFATIFTDAVFSCTALRVNQALSRYVPVYAFEFNDPKAATLIKSPGDLPNLGSHHSSSLAYTFQTPVAGLSDPALFTPSGVQESLNFASDHQCEYWLPLDLQ